MTQPTTSKGKPVRLDLDETPENAVTARQYAGLAAVVLVSELTAASYLLVSTALPGIAVQYQTTQTAWVLTLPTLATVVALCFLGKLADMRGKRLILIAAIVLATVGAVMSALAPNYAVLLAGRALSGLLYGVPALAYSLIRDVFPKRMVAFATALTFAGVGLGFGLAPFLSGWLVDSFGVSSVFWFMVIYQAVCAVVLLLTVPESPLRLHSKLDWPGALLIGIGSGAVLYALGQGSQWGWSSMRTIGLFVVGVACFAAWLWWDKRFSYPLIDHALLRSKPMWTTVLTAFFVFAVFATIPAIVPTLLQTPSTIGGEIGFGIDAYGVAFFLGPMGLGLIVGGLTVGARARHWGIRTPMIVAFGLLAVSTLGLAFRHSNLWEIVVWLVIYGLAMGVAYGGYPNLVLQASPPESQGISATFVVVIGNLGTGLVTQLTFVVLADYLIPESGGAFFESQGYTIVFGATAVLAVLGLLSVLLLPHGRRRDVLEMRAGEEDMAKVAANQ
ncbi:MFS transporter [Nocardia sp. CA-290969]|uniref:MFS transporter n=1 Tax=Nocardia sp. CA-290969 TaxID=3239986 RepID=UPI003D8BA787